MIDVAPIEVAGAGEVVELVAEEAVAPAGGELQAYAGQRRGKDEGRRGVARGLRGARWPRRVGQVPPPPVSLTAGLGSLHSSVISIQSGAEGSGPTMRPATWRWAAKVPMPARQRGRYGSNRATIGAPTPPPGGFFRSSGPGAVARALPKGRIMQCRRTHGGPRTSGAVSSLASDRRRTRHAIDLRSVQ